MNVKRYKTIQRDVYNDNGVFVGVSSTLVSDVSNNSEGVGLFDYEEYDEQSAYGYDHSAYAPDLGDK